MSRSLPLAPFTSPWLLRGGHRQTLAGVWARQQFPAETARQHPVSLPDGDAVVLHDDAPPQWQPGDRVALMVHGLAGSHASPYMRRIAARLNSRGVRTFRLDQRTCGAGLTLARRAYHCGRSDDVRTALWWLTETCPGSPLALVGFSMGGSLVLKMAGEAPDRIPPRLESVFAACPPLELQRCVRLLQRGIRRLYDQYFARLLRDHVVRWQAANPEAPRVTFRRPPRSIEEFDDVFTAPLGGFASAADYYAQSSPLQFVPQIEVPTLLVAAHDDPMVDPQPVRQLDRPPVVTTQLVPGGGHLGFISRGGNDPDHWWLDWRVVDWVSQGRPATATGSSRQRDALECR
jgi:predicted alpha/beta-fold hydrolase